MSGYLVPPTKNPGDVLTSALWNTYIRDNLDFGMVRPIADQTLGSPAATIDFTSIPATFAHLMLVLYARTDVAAVTNAAVGIRANNDSGNNYIFEYLESANTTVGGSAPASTSSFQVGKFPAATALANYFAAGWLLIPHYANALNLKAMLAFGGGVWNGSNGAENLTAGVWNNGNAINRLTLISPGNFVASTRGTLYGMGGI